MPMPPSSMPIIFAMPKFTTASATFDTVLRSNTSVSGRSANPVRSRKSATSNRAASSVSLSLHAFDSESNRSAPRRTITGLLLVFSSDGFIIIIIELASSGTSSTSSTSSSSSSSSLGCTTSFVFTSNLSAPPPPVSELWCLSKLSYTMRSTNAKVVLSMPCAATACSSSGVPHQGSLRSAGYTKRARTAGVRRSYAHSTVCAIAPP
mmetsp:Transcript_15206/g.38388  ORF Transcript_15206/g.38388 Transcript_15206/m.38388 type:complete len:207 (-) Transcript_15206:527-1147(-)